MATDFVEYTILLLFKRRRKAVQGKNLEEMELIGIRLQLGEWRNQTHFNELFKKIG